jgi:hypothetical protein
LDVLQTEIEKIEKCIYDCEAIIEGKATGKTEKEREESSQKKARLEQERETKVVKRAGRLKKLFDDALAAVLPLCNSDKNSDSQKLRGHLRD